MSTTETPTIAPVKELRRTRDDRILAGVAGGLGRYFDLTPTFFRIGFVILTLIGGAGILLYVAAALVIPNEGEAESVASDVLKRHRERPWALFGLALVGIAIVSIVAQAEFWPNSGFAWTLLLLGGLAIVVAQRRADPAPAADAEALSSEDQPTATMVPRAERPPRRPSLFMPVLGVLLALGGLLALLAMLGVGVRWDLALAAAAVGTGVAVVAGSFLQRRTGGLVFVGLVLATLAIAVSAVDVRLDGPIGSRTYTPVDAADVRSSYEVAIGELRVDLSNVTFTEGETSIDANVGIGSLEIVVPPEVAVALDVDATASAGDIRVLGRQDDGFDADISLFESANVVDRVLRIDAHVGFGEVVITRDTP